MSAGDNSQVPTGFLPVIDPEDLPGIFAAASDYAFVLSSAGVVQRIVCRNSEQLAHWQGQHLRDFLTEESRPKLDDLLEGRGQQKGRDGWIELNHVDGAPWPFPVRYTAHPIGSHGDILLLGRDQRLVAETQQQLVNAQIILERGYEERREYDARYRMLLANTTDPFLFVSATDGRIRDLNASAASLLGASRDDLTGALVAQEFKDRRRGEFVDNLLNLSFAENAHDITVQTKRTRRDVRIFPTVFRAAGERMIICRLASETTGQQVDDLLTRNLNALFEQGTDAVVFTDAKGGIETANDAFLDMIDMARQSDVKGLSLGDFFARSQIDLGVVLENALRSGHMRIYATKLINAFGAETPVEMSVTYLNNREHPSVGFVIRDASRVNAFRSAPSSPGLSAPMDKDVAELVGSATLKEILAESNEVIERICIETAVELTRNNRAAAAEMLGLSRQSLYVKLRKYGLLEKSGS